MVRRTGHRSGLLMAVGIVTMTLTGCMRWTPSSPVWATAPSVAPAATASGGCTYPLASTVPDTGLVTLGPRPTGAIAIWLPGQTSTTCHAQLTTIGPIQAGALAADIRAALALYRRADALLIAIVAGHTLGA